MGYDLGSDDGPPNHFLCMLRIVVGKEIGRNARRRGDYDTAVQGYEMALEGVGTYREDITALLEKADSGSDTSDELVKIEEVLGYWERFLHWELEDLQVGTGNE